MMMIVVSLSANSAAGFVIKPITLQGVVLNVKEIGGAPVYRPYWSRYYQDIAGVVSSLAHHCIPSFLHSFFLF